MVTWQGSSPRPRTSASTTRSSSPEPVRRSEEDRADDEALGGPENLIEAAETETGSDSPDPVPGPADLEQQRAQQRRADHLMVEAVIEQGLGGARHQFLEEQLIRYAVPVLRYLLASGKIVSKATQLRRPPALKEAWLDFAEDDHSEFANEMVASALPGFTRAVFKDRRWNPNKGASLKTYFVNACILQFARLQHQWLEQRQAVRPAGLEFAPDGFPSAPDPAGTVIAQDEAARILSAISDEALLEVLVLRAAGWTAAEAAREAGLTVKAAEARLARLRRRLRADGQDHEHPPAGSQGPCREDGDRHGGRQAQQSNDRGHSTPGIPG